MTRGSGIWQKSSSQDPAPTGSRSSSGSGACEQKRSSQDSATIWVIRAPPLPQDAKLIRARLGETARDRRHDPKRYTHPDQLCILGEAGIPESCEELFFRTHRSKIPHEFSPLWATLMTIRRCPSLHTHTTPRHLHRYPTTRLHTYQALRGSRSSSGSRIPHGLSPLRARLVTIRRCPGLHALTPGHFHTDLTARFHTYTPTHLQTYSITALPLCILRDR